MRQNSYVRFDWSVIFRVRIAKNVLINVTEIRDELKKIGIKTRIKNREKLLDLLKSKQQWFCCYFLRPHVRNRFIGIQK
jgi:hypothetical protein